MQSNIKTPEHKGAATREKSQTFSNQRATRLQSIKAQNHSKSDKILGNSSIDAAIRGRAKLPIDARNTQGTIFLGRNHLDSGL